MTTMSSISMAQIFVSIANKDNEKEVVTSGGWSTLFSLSGQNKPSPPPPETANIAKTSLTATTVQNLEICTETLGCETGVIYSVSDSRELSGDFTLRSRRKRRNAPSQFPPPLTTLGGGDRLRLSTKREDGRLLLIPFKPTLLEAKRSDGHLRLRLLPSMAVHALGRNEEAKEENMCSDEAAELNANEQVDGLAFGGNGEYNRRGGRCTEEGDGGAMGVVGCKRSKEIMWISDALWVSSS